jgi:hypothetical protein
MKSDGALRHFVLAFLLALACYAILYFYIEHRRTRKGPWEIAFTNNSAGAPTLVINQPKLAITNVQITFPDQPARFAGSPSTLVLRQPQEVPFDVPFGKCVFIDTRFLPGRVTFLLFGHEVELLPRALVIDHQEHPWLSESTNLTVHALPPTSSREDIR